MLLSDRGQPYLGTARLKARAVTLNNLGCLMKKWGKPRVAIAYLSRALRIEASLPGGADNPAGTHLNMSTALSAVGMHREAAGHASRAIELASRAMAEGSPDSGLSTAETRSDGCAESAQGPEVSGSNVEGENGGHQSMLAHRGGAGEVSRFETSGGHHKLYIEESLENGRVLDGLGEEPERLPADGGLRAQRGDQAAAGGLLAIAYFNLAVEREHLGEVDMALEAYKDARVAADQHLGSDSPVSRGIELAIEAVSKAKALAASTNRRRCHTCRGIDSLPSIGMLRLCVRSKRSDLRYRGLAGTPDFSPGRSRTPRDFAGNGDLEVDNVRNPIQAVARAYISPRPNPNSPRRSFTSSRSTPSPNSSSTAQSFVGGCHGRGAHHGREGLLWRAHACATFGCSPREALYAQKAEEREREAGDMVCKRREEFPRRAEEDRGSTRYRGGVGEQRSLGQPKMGGGEVESWG